MRPVPLRVCATAALAALASSPALAQDRPGEEEIFGKPAPQPAPSPQEGLPPRPSEGEIFGETPQTPSPAPPLQIKEDPLKIGGMLYLRGSASWQEGVPPSDWLLSSPNLFDGYFDVRPNDRVRGFLLGRMLFDPTIDPKAPTAFGTAPPTNPQVLLDQMWLRFDVERTVFVTAGRQHVKWGTGHFWNPTDYLHPVRRDPLAVFDQRTGTTMLKLHVPWEKRGWNFYGVALLDGDVYANQLGKVGAGGRAEAVFGTVEVGVDGLVRKGRDARFGVDMSAGIWDLDVYGEAALRSGSDVALLRTTPIGPPDPTHPFGVYQSYTPGFSPQVTAGVSWSWKYSDEDSLTIGAEYFYNSLGYEDPRIYPQLIYLQGQTGLPYFVPFYLGSHYAGLYLLLPKPGSWNDTNFTISTLANLSDSSFISRVDYSVLVLTYLTVEAYVAGHYGTKGGEFRFAIDLPSGLAPGGAGVSVAPPILDLGVALRVSL